MLNETIDGSVFTRWRDDPSYRPRKLAESAERRAVDEELEGGVVTA